MGKLKVYLEKAKNLPNKETFGKSDPYATLTLKNVVKEREAGQVSRRVQDVSS